MAPTNGNDIDFETLTPAEQEAYIARGEYKDPSALDHGNAPKGAPSGPVANDDDKVGDVEKSPDPDAASDKPKSTRKRTT